MRIQLHYLDLEYSQSLEKPMLMFTEFDTLLALDNNLNGGNPRNGFVSQRVIDPQRKCLTTATVSPRRRQTP